MLGLYVAILATVVGSANWILLKQVLNKEDAISVSVLSHVLASIFFIPFLFLEQFPTQSIAWIILISSIIFWALAGLIGFYVFQNLEVSILGLITKVSLVFSFLFALIFLKESITFTKILGFILILLGIILISYTHIEKNKIKKKWLFLSFLNSLFVAIGFILDKSAMNYFKPLSYAFFVYFFPGLLLVPFVIKKKKEIMSVFKNSTYMFFASLVVGAISYYLILLAFKLEEASIVMPILEVGSIFTVFGGIIFLKEEDHIIRKIIASIIIIGGAVFIGLNI